MYVKHSLYHTVYSRVVTDDFEQFDYKIESKKIGLEAGTTTGTGTEPHIDQPLYILNMMKVCRGTTVCSALLTSVLYVDERRLYILQ
jgi:hypothetical protein